MCHKNSKTERLTSDHPKITFQARMKQNQLKTFSCLIKIKVVKKAGGRAMILKAERSLFGHTRVMGEGRKLQMKDMLSHSLGSLPWALATPEGFLRKTNKAMLAASLKKSILPVEDIPTNSTMVIDGMSLGQ